MPLPLIIGIGIAASTGLSGIGSSIKAGIDKHNADVLNKNSNDRLKSASSRLETLRKQCYDALSALGEEKVYVLNNSIKRFVDSFSKLKNVNLSEKNELSDISRICIDSKQFEELKEMSSIASTFLAGSAIGAAGGALAAFGAYSAAAAFATASTGTAISALSGAAATNATLAFFGGGSLATGGLGIAGGTAVLGGLVAGPALLVMGAITSAIAGKELEKAKTTAAETDIICGQLEKGAVQCVAIRRKVYSFYMLLARLDAVFLPLVYEMENIINNDGTDYSEYSDESRRTVASAASVAVAIKTILDTPLLSEDGNLTEHSESVEKQCSVIIEKFR